MRFLTISAVIVDAPKKGLKAGNMRKAFADSADPLFNNRFIGVLRIRFEGLILDGIKETNGKIEGASNLSKLVDYQKAVIASRTIIDKDSGTVTVFAFDEGQKLSEHTAPYDAMVFVIDGEAEVTIEKKASKLKEGDMIIMPANKPHAVRALKKFKMLLIMVRE